MYYIGIDPGTTGAAAILDGEGALVRVFDLPTYEVKVSSKVRRVLDPPITKRLLDPYQENAVFIVEKVASRPMQAVQSIFSLGDTFGVLRAISEIMSPDVFYITPQKWKKYYQLGSAKDKSLEIARDLYPDAPLTRKKDHNRAEALLLAHYGYLNNLGDD